MSEPHPKLLIVDDETSNLQLVKQILQDQYQLSFATNGNQALKVAKKIQPDLIILDVMMPDMDGYQTCQGLKAQQETAGIPVIFCTALGSEEDEARGFEVGGVDYITKPATPMRLRARINTHIELKIARDKLIQQTELLLENDRLRDDIDNIVRHDLKGPLLGIINFPKIILSRCDLTEDCQQKLEYIPQLAYKMLDMINHSLDIYKMEKGIYEYKPQPVKINSVLEDISRENENSLKAKHLTYETIFKGFDDGEDTSVTIYGDQLLLYSMFSNLIKNAIEASPRGETITLTIENINGVTFRIHNKGAVPADIRDRFFEKYVTAGKEKGTGLGTYSARLTAETLQGSLALKTDDGFGTEIILVLPGSS